jgi:hypothetical protein
MRCNHPARQLKGNAQWGKPGSKNGCRRPRRGAAALEPVINFPAGCVASENRLRSGVPSNRSSSLGWKSKGRGQLSRFRRRCRSETLGIRHSSLLELRKIGSRRRPRES